MTGRSQINIRDLHLPCTIGHYALGTTVPRTHVLDLTLTIAPELLQIETDDMALVFDYDPLLGQINQIAGAQHYVTQEYLLTQIVMACANYPQIMAVDAQLRKGPVQGGSIGVQMILSEAELASMRATLSWPG